MEGHRHSNFKKKNVSTLLGKHKCFKLENCLDSDEYRFIFSTSLELIVCIIYLETNGGKLDSIKSVTRRVQLFEK